MAESAMKLISMSVDAMASVAKKYEAMKRANYSKWRIKWIWAIQEGHHATSSRKVSNYMGSLL